MSSEYKRMITKTHGLITELTDKERKEIIEMIRLEVASIYFDLFKKRNTWV